MSVVKQLDVVPLERLRVFGRVHISTTDEYVIGADADGTLAISRYSTRPSLSAPFIDEEDLEGGHVIVCRTIRKQSGQLYRLSLNGQTLEVSARATEQRDQQHRTNIDTAINAADARAQTAADRTRVHV